MPANCLQIQWKKRWCNLRKITFITLGFLAAVNLSAQVLLPTPETAFEPQHHFNPLVIKSKGIKRIVFEILDKKDFEVAVDQNLMETYQFNADGLLSRYYFTTIVKTVEKQVAARDGRGRSYWKTVTDYMYDTISTTYFYSGLNLVLKRYHDGFNYYESRYYSYDSLDRLTKELRFKETNSSTDRSVFILGNQVLLSEDSFQYKRFSPLQQKCIFVNSENRPYKEQITNYDTLGRKVAVNENYTAAGWITQETHYAYLGNHLLQAQFEGNTGNKVTLKSTYEYDAQDELYSEKQYKNDALVKEISYVTDKTDSLLNSVIVRDTLNKSIRIIRLKYDTGQMTQTH